jgi:plastocyanin
MSMRPGIGSFPLFAVLALAAACGDSTPAGSSLPPGYYITISSLAYAPLDLAAPSGATVTVVNRDAMTHSVTQQAAAGAFTPGAPGGGTPFDTGLFTGTRTFTLPTGLADGTVLHYYCTSHTSTMLTPNGTITIRSAAPVGNGPDPVGGGSNY